MEKKETKFRHELKYVISAGELALIRNRINHLIPCDSHVSESGAYSIRSCILTTTKTAGSMKTKTAPIPARSSAFEFTMDLQKESRWSASVRSGARHSKHPVR